MKIKLDENLPQMIALRLSGLGHDVHTTFEEGLAGRPDSQIWEVAQQEERFLITQDMDFSDTRRFTPGLHHGILLIRLRSPSRLALAERISQIFQTEDVNRWARCFVVVTEHKIRVRPPVKPTSLSS
jgi:predicted nuclease of predicted toxin-antitoxin system